MEFFKSFMYNLKYSSVVEMKASKSKCVLYIELVILNDTEDPAVLRCKHLTEHILLIYCKTVLHIHEIFN